MIEDVAGLRALPTGTYVRDADADEWKIIHEDDTCDDPGCANWVYGDRPDDGVHGGIVDVEDMPLPVEVIPKPQWAERPGQTATPPRREPAAWAMDIVDAPWT